MIIIMPCSLLELFPLLHHQEARIDLERLGQLLQGIEIDSRCTSALDFAKSGLCDTCTPGEFTLRPAFGCS